MKRWNTTLLTAALLVLWSVGTVLAIEPQGEDAKKELKKFQGAWTMVTGEQGGKKIADAHVCRSQISFAGDKGQIIVPNQTEEKIIFEIVKIDPTTNPKQMHFVRKNGPMANQTLIGIYEFTGDDNYHFAFDPTGNTTPKDFQSKEGTKHVHNTWTRVKP